MADPIACVKEIAQDLIGCCSGSRVELEKELDKLGVARQAEPSAAFDEIVFVCDGCGWYCAADELNTETGDSLCEDCFKDA